MSRTALGRDAERLAARTLQALGCRVHTAEPVKRGPYAAGGDVFDAFDVVAIGPLGVLFVQVKSGRSRRHPGVLWAERFEAFAAFAAVSYEWWHLEPEPEPASWRITRRGVDGWATLRRDVGTGVVTELSRPWRPRASEGAAS